MIRHYPKLIALLNKCLEMEPTDRCSSFAEIVSRMQTIGSEIGKPDEETGEIESWNKNHILPLNMDEGRVLFDPGLMDHQDSF